MLSESETVTLALEVLIGENPNANRIAQLAEAKMRQYVFLVDWARRRDIPKISRN